MRKFLCPLQVPVDETLVAMLPDITDVIVREANVKRTARRASPAPECIGLDYGGYALPIVDNYERKKSDSVI